jgi:predicted  nucleic acid-binding Zn-ribbon protein
MKQLVDILAQILNLLKEAGKITLYTVVIGGSGIIIIGGFIINRYLDDIKSERNNLIKATGQIEYIYENTKSITEKVERIEQATSSLSTKIDGLSGRLNLQDQKLNCLVDNMPDKDKIYRQFFEIQLKMDNANENLNRITGNREQVKKNFGMDLTLR